MDELNRKELTVRAERLMRSVDGDDMPLSEARDIARGLTEALVAAERRVAALESEAAALRSEHNRMTAAEAAARMGSFDWDIVEDAVTWSPGLYRLAGIEPAAEVDSITFIDSIHEADRDRVNQSIQTALDGGAPLDAAFRLVRPDGGTLDCRAAAQIFKDEEGEPARMICIVRDAAGEDPQTRAQQEADARFNEIVERHAAPMLIIDPESGAVKTANPASLKLFGFNLDQILSMNAAGLGAAVHDLKRACEQRQPLHAEYRLPNGNTRQLEFRCGIIPENDTPAVLAIVQDVTARHNAERALEQERLRGDAALREAQEIANTALNEQTERAREALKDQAARLEKMESVAKQARGAAGEFHGALSAIHDGAQRALEELNASSPGYLELNEIKNRAARASKRAAELNEEIAGLGHAQNENAE